jgi:hypothetical protein
MGAYIKMKYETFIDNLTGRDKEHMSDGKYIRKWSYAITSYSLPRVTAQLEITRGKTKKSLMRKREELVEERAFLKRRLGELIKSEGK